MGTMLILARLIVPAEFGRYAVAMVIASLALVPGIGVGSAVVQRSTLSREYLQAASALVLVSAVVIVGLAFAVASLIIAPVFGSRTADLVRLTTPMCFISATTSLPNALLQRRLEFRRLGIIDVASGVSASAASLAMGVDGMGAYALVLGATAGMLVQGVLSCAFVRPPRPGLPREATREVVSYAIPASLAAFSWIGFSNCDYAIVGVRLGVLSTGLYFRAYNLAVEYQKKVSQLLHTVGFPVLSRTQNQQEMNAARSHMIRQMTLILFPLLVILGIVAPVFVPWFFGHNWAAAGRPAQILAIGGASVLVIDAVGAALMAAGRPRALLAYGWAHFATYALAVFLVAPLGLNAVALSASIVHTAFLYFAYVLMLSGTQESPLKSLWHDVAPATVSCAGAALTAVPTGLMLSSAHVGAAAYLAVVVVVGSTAYVLTLRTLFRDSWRSLLRLAGHLLPDRASRTVTRHDARPTSHREPRPAGAHVAIWSPGARRATRQSQHAEAQESLAAAATTLSR